MQVALDKGICQIYLCIYLLTQIITIKNIVLKSIKDKISNINGQKEVIWQNQIRIIIYVLKVTVIAFVKQGKEKKKVIGENLIKGYSFDMTVKDKTIKRPIIL